MIVTFITNEINPDISYSFASDRVVALRGYAPAHWQTRARVWRNQSPVKFREGRPNQGGQQVVQDLTDHRVFENPARLKGQQGSSFSWQFTTFQSAALPPLNQNNTDRTS